MRLHRRLPTLALALAALVASPRPARAEYDPLRATIGAVAEAIAKMQFWASFRIGTSASVADWKHPGGVAVRGSMSLQGIGLAAALRYERVGGAHGGLLSVGPELHPLSLARSELYYVLDPFVGLGTEIGGGQDGFRSAGYVSGGLDLALFRSRDLHPAITLEYEVRPLRYPSTLPLQLLHVGGALRGVF